MKNNNNREEIKKRERRARSWIILFGLVTGYEVKSEDILRDLWVYYHNPVLTEERLHRATEAGCERPKLWMCRCPDYIFERCVYIVKKTTGNFLIFAINKISYLFLLKNSLLNDYHSYIKGSSWYPDPLKIICKMNSLFSLF